MDGPLEDGTVPAAVLPGTAAGLPTGMALALDSGAATEGLAVTVTPAKVSKAAAGGMDAGADRPEEGVTTEPLLKRLI